MRLQARSIRLRALFSSRQLTRPNSRSTQKTVTKPPVESVQYPFLGWDIAKIVHFLQENASKTVVDGTAFLIADVKTTLDEDTLLLVYNIGNSQESIRLSAGYANSQAVSVSVATTDVGELRSLADNDGVYRGVRIGRRQERVGRRPGSSYKTIEIFMTSSTAGAELYLTSMNYWILPALLCVD